MAGRGPFTDALTAALRLKKTAGESLVDTRANSSSKVTNCSMGVFWFAVFS